MKGRKGKQRRSEKCVYKMLKQSTREILKRARKYRKYTKILSKEGKRARKKRGKGEQKEVIPLSDEKWSASEKVVRKNKSGRGKYNSNSEKASSQGKRVEKKLKNEDG